MKDLARRVGDLEGAVRALKKAKAPPQAEIPVRSAGGGKDYDKAIMKLGRDINNLRKQLADALQGLGNRGGSSGGFSRVPDGDHAMLSSKPLLGYRCMACDRPLEKLDENPGPYIPTNLMPVNVTPYERRGLGLPVPHDAPPKPMHEAKPSSEQVAMRGVRAGSDGRGPQNWYKDIHGKPGDSLPAREVGPILPPGGWRGNETGVPVVPTNAAGRQVDKLPGLVPEGTGNAVGGLAPARGGPTTLPNIS